MNYKLKVRLILFTIILVMLGLLTVMCVYICNRIEDMKEEASAIALSNYIKEQDKINSGTIRISEAEYNEMLVEINFDAQLITSLSNRVEEYQHILLEADEYIAGKEMTIESLIEEFCISPALSEELLESRQTYLHTLYPTQYKIWCYLIDNGFSDVAAAGILGNIESESSFNPNALNKSSMAYGLCQWLKKYSPNVYGKDIDYQLQHLVATATTSFNTYGYLYKKGFNFEAFNKLNNEKDAAEAFAVIYERPGSTNYTARKANASKWYGLFAFTYVYVEER